MLGGPFAHTLYLYNSYNLHFFLQIVKGRNTSIFLFSITNDFFFLIIIYDKLNFNTLALRVA